MDFGQLIADNWALVIGALGIIYANRQSIAVIHNDMGWIKKQIGVVESKADAANRRVDILERKN